MGMNYYVVGKDTNDLAKGLEKTYDKIYYSDDLKNYIYSSVLKKFKKTLDFLNEHGMESRTELFTDCLEDAVDKFMCDIKYDVLDTLHLEERERIHIGKSSYGWLFGFQSQNTELEGVPVKWNSYDEVKKWLTEYVEKRKIFIIEDEEGQEWTVKDLFDKIDDTQKDPFNLENPDNFTYNRNVGGYRFSDRDFS